MAATNIEAPVHTSILAETFDDDSLRNQIAERPVEALSANEVLFTEGDAADSLYEVVSGVLRTYRMLPDGRRAITGFLFAGELLGVPCRDGYVYTAEAVTSVKVRSLARAKLLQLIDDSTSVRRDLLAVAYDEMCAAQDQMLLLARKTAEERVASFLLKVARRATADGSISTDLTLPMPRLDIADYLGLTIETVSRLISKFKASGMIALLSPSKVALVDIERLAQTAGEDIVDLQTPATVRHASGWSH